MSAATSSSVKSAVNFFNNLQSPSATEKPFIRPKVAVKPKTTLPNDSERGTSSTKTQRSPDTFMEHVRSKKTSSITEDSAIRTVFDDLNAPRHGDIINVKTVEDNGNTIHKVFINIDNSGNAKLSAGDQCSSVPSNSNLKVEKSDDLVQTVRSEFVSPVESARNSDISVYKRIDVSLPPCSKRSVNNNFF